MSMCTKISNSQKYKDTQCACVWRYPLCICTKIPTTHTDKPVRFIHLQKFNNCNIFKNYRIPYTFCWYACLARWSTHLWICEYLGQCCGCARSGCWVLGIYYYCTCLHRWRCGSGSSDFDNMKFLKSLLIPTNLPHSNMQPIALTCDAVCYSFLDCLLWDGAWAKSLNGSLSDTPLHTCFYLTDGITTLSWMTQILSQV